jgi:hypothetical protein
MGRLPAACNSKADIFRYSNPTMVNGNPAIFEITGFNMKRTEFTYGHSLRT